MIKTTDSLDTKTETYHTAKGLTGSERPDDQWDVQVRVDSPAFIAALQTAHVVLQFALVQLIYKVSLRS